MYLEVLWGIKVLDLITLLALVAGPLMAVLVTRYADGRSEVRERRMSVFRTLMRTRRMRLSADHVGALNLVEIEFDNVAPVITAFKEYIQHLNAGTRDNEDNAVVEAWLREQDKRLSKLLHKIGDALGFKIEQLDIFDGGYAPQGWNNNEAQQTQLRWLLMEWLKGNRAVAVTERVNPQPGRPFPPPPAIED